MRSVFVSIFALLALVSSPARALEFYLYVPSIAGPSNTPGFAGDIQLLALSFDEGGHSVTVEKRVDATSPTFFAASSTGRIFPFVDLLIYNVSGAQAQPDSVIQLNGAAVARYLMDSGSNPATEHVSFSDVSAAVVPEPSTAALLSTGLIASMALVSRRRRRT